MTEGRAVFTRSYLAAEDQRTFAAEIRSEGKTLHNVWCKFLAELVGTFFLVLTVGCNVLAGSVAAALSIGSMLTVMVFSLGSVSGAHLNPAVTAAVFFSRRNLMTWQSSLGYITAQLMGGAFAAGVYSFICGGAFLLEPVGRHGLVAASSVEAIYTTALCYVVLNVATTEKQDGNQYSGLAIGFTVVAAALAAGGISGCSLNPAVSFGATLAASMTKGWAAWRYFPLYFFVPFVGSVTAFALFFVVRRVDEYGGPQRSRTRRP